MISVEIPAPYLSLNYLVSAIAKAVARVCRSSDELVNIEESEAAAAVTWEAKLRALTESRAVKGHRGDTFAVEDWAFLSFERDAFFVDDLNACKQLTEAGLSFTVVEDQREQMEFGAGFIEVVNNNAGISWRYWVEQMPTLSAAEAARLMAGLDPDLYADLNSRPVPKNNVDAVCKKAMALERLATAEGMTRATPGEWLEWAHERQLNAHIGFVLAVCDKRDRDAVDFAFNALPAKEADHWRNGHPVEDGRRLVTYKLAGLQSAQNFTLAAFVEEVTARMARWQAGSYAVAEAAQILADAGTDIDAEVLCQQMESAIHAVALKLRLNDVPLSKNDIPRGRLWNRFVQESDVNDWFASTGARYRLRFPYPPRVVGAGAQAVAEAFREVPAETHEKVPARVVAGSSKSTRLVPFKKAALIAAHVHEWPTIARDISDANANGLADAAKASERGWDEAAALNWARAKGKLISTNKPADSLVQAMHNLGALPSRKHTMQG